MGIKTYPWPPDAASVLPCPASIVSRVYPDYPMILYHQAAQRLVEAVSKFGSSPTLWASVVSRLADHGEMVVHDAVHLGRTYFLPVAELRALNGWEAEMGYYDQERATAVSEHVKLQDLDVGRLLRVNGADGYGWYAVTKRHARSVDVEYKCFGGDVWLDRFISSKDGLKIPLAYARPLLYRGTE